MVEINARAYSKDGYTGELLLDVQSIKVEATGYSTVMDSHGDVQQDNVHQPTGGRRISGISSLQGRGRQNRSRKRDLYRDLYGQ